jgi:hypothetical protein
LNYLTAGFSIGVVAGDFALASEFGIRDSPKNRIVDTWMTCFVPEISELKQQIWNFDKLSAGITGDGVDVRFGRFGISGGFDQFLWLRFSPNPGQNGENYPNEQLDKMDKIELN